jgi:hypothetical protein
VKPETAAYGAYADAQIEELIARYKPSVLWNDIDWPKSGHALKVEADYYNAVPDGVVDDRFGIAHTDFTSPEYEKLDKISEKKWEECRGLGRSFGYNRAEGEAETIAPQELVTPTGRYREQEWQSLARCGPGGRWNDPSGSDGSAAQARGMDEAEWRGDLRGRGRGGAPRARPPMARR